MIDTSKILGELPKTGDGYILGWNWYGQLYIVRGNRQHIERWAAKNDEQGWSPPLVGLRPEQCFLTRVGAENARVCIDCNGTGLVSDNDGCQRCEGTGAFK